MRASEVEERAGNVRETVFEESVRDGEVVHKGAGEDCSITGVGKVEQTLYNGDHLDENGLRAERRDGIRTAFDMVVVKGLEEGGVWISSPQEKFGIDLEG